MIKLKIYSLISSFVFVFSVLQLQSQSQVRIGYYDMQLGEGNPSQVAAITESGHMAVNIFSLSSEEIQSIDVLILQNPNNGGYGQEFTAQLGVIQQSIAAGLRVVIHDRFVSGANDILPGEALFEIKRDFTDSREVEFLSDAISTGLDNDSLDGGNSSSHGFALAQSLPAGADLLLSNSTPSEILSFGYAFGKGYIIYSTIPLDYYLGNPNHPLHLNMQKYAVGITDYAVTVSPSQVALLSRVQDVEVTVGTSPAPIVFFVGSKNIHVRDIEVKIESDNQFILPNDDILHGRPEDLILLGDRPKNRILPGGEVFPENLPPFTEGNDLLGSGGPADYLLERGVPADLIDQRLIILPTLRRIGSASLTITATTPSGREDESRFRINVISDQVIIIDDGDPGFAAQGSWANSNALGGYNGDSLFSDQPGSKAVFTPEIPGPGTFAVYARWATRDPFGLENYERDRGASFVINHSGGVTSTSVDQNQDGGRFNLLGIFDFSADGSENVTLERVNVLGGFTSADAVRFVSAPSTNGNEQPRDLIVDNLNAGFSTSGIWHESNANDEYAGSSVFTEISGNMAHFSAGDVLDGIHEVYVRSSARSPRGGFYNRDSHAQYQVNHANGHAAISVNQNVLPGQWVFIGAFPFSSGTEAAVKLTRINEDASQKTSADAVRFTELQPARPNEVIVDNKDAGFTSFGDWIESNASDEYLQSSLAGFGWGTTAKWTPELPGAGRYQVFAHWANQGEAGPLRRDAKAWYEVNHGGQKKIVRIDQNKNGSNWVSIGTFDFTADGAEFVELYHGFEDTVAVSADAIRFLLVE